MKRFFILFFISLYFVQNIWSAEQPAPNDAELQNLRALYGAHPAAQHCLPEIVGYPNGDFDPQHQSFRHFTTEFGINWHDVHGQTMAFFFFEQYIHMNNPQARNATFFSIPEFVYCAHESANFELAHAPNLIAQNLLRVLSILGLQAMVWATYNWYKDDGYDLPMDDPANPLFIIKAQHEYWPSHEYIPKFLQVFRNAWF